MWAPCTEAVRTVGGSSVASDAIVKGALTDKDNDPQRRRPYSLLP
jgi:hypothetical protein